MIRTVFYVTWLSNGTVQRDGWYATKADAEYVRAHHERVYGGIYSIESSIIIR